MNISPPPAYTDDIAVLGEHRADGDGAGRAQTEAPCGMASARGRSRTGCENDITVKVHRQ